jgi:hypothetical protein
MRKRIVVPAQQEKPAPPEGWLDLERVAEVEITSEDPEHPIEAALLPNHSGEWRAAAPGQQSIRLVFSEPSRLRRIWLRFIEPGRARTQEYVVRWSPDDGRSFREVVRQRWNFSPQGATGEAEDHRVDLSGVTILELSIIPDISGGDARASLTELRLA